MSLVGIIETLRRNLKAVVLGCYVVLALVVVADVVRVATAEEHEAAAPASEHAVAPAAEHTGHAAVAATEESTEPAEAHGFWASAYHIAETKPVFWTAFGFLGCVLLVVVSKTYGHLGVSEREDYYSE